MYLYLCVLESTRMSCSKVSFIRLWNRKCQADFTQGSFEWWNFLLDTWCSLCYCYELQKHAAYVCVSLCTCFLNVPLTLCQMSENYCPSLANVHQWSSSVLLNVFWSNSHPRPPARTPEAVSRFWSWLKDDQTGRHQPLNVLLDGTAGPQLPPMATHANAESQLVMAIQIQASIKMTHQI